MSSSAEIPTDDKEPIDNIVYNTFVNKFNEEYASSLNESQKTLFKKYISSFSDNGLEMKYYINEEISNLKTKLDSSKNLDYIVEDNDLKVKIDEVYSLLDSYKDKEVDTDLLEIILKTQLLVDEIEKDDDIS